MSSSGLDTTDTPARVRAPQLRAGAWLNVAEPLSLDALRGRFVLLDFWTSCCGNCLHVLDELRPLEAEYADVLTVVGVHSPKFPHEALPSTVAAAIERYGVAHPVLNDPELLLWQQYAVRAWPTLVLIDPEGYLVAQAAGEGHVPALATRLAALVAEHEARGTLRRGPGPVVVDRATTGTLRYPAGALLLPAERTGRDAATLLVADAGHHQLAELTADGGSELRRIGTGTRGRRDGSADSAEFAEPNGLALLPAGRAPFDVLVADTANHVLRGVRLTDGAVVATLDLPAALAGTATVTGPIPAVLSPWDVAWWPARNRAVVAAAGVHLLLEVDPASGATDVLAGTTVEGVRDGAAADAWLAQPSGLAVDGERVWFVDAESSALRYVTADRTVHTAVGEGLFDFGHVDGPANNARLQHPLGLAVLPDGSLALADTYNGALRRYDPGTDTVTTLARGLAEPADVIVVGGAPVVVESAAHRIVRPTVAAEDVAGPAVQTNRPPVAVRAGRVELTVAFDVPDGRALDDRYGPATRLSVSASPTGILSSGAGESQQLHRTLQVTGSGVLQVVAQVASCDDDPAVEHPACHLTRQDWGVPVVIDPDGTDVLRLVLLG
ncbi:MAG TPA: thioredoxin-like domain-containing protein [Jatrophihabitans sp.]|nr:thioredoxin-like domain-containing protein [Jatrophihabitans sp.]